MLLWRGRAWDWRAEHGAGGARSLPLTIPMNPPPPGTELRTPSHAHFPAGLSRSAGAAGPLPSVTVRPAHRSPAAAHHPPPRPMHRGRGGAGARRAGRARFPRCTALGARAEDLPPALPRLPAPSPGCVLVWAGCGSVAWGVCVCVLEQPQSEGCLLVRLADTSPVEPASTGPANAEQSQPRSIPNFLPKHPTLRPPDAPPGGGHTHPWLPHPQRGARRAAPRHRCLLVDYGKRGVGAGAGKRARRPRH